MADETRPPSDEEALLSQMHQEWDYDTAEWREIREQGKTDIRYVAGDPWDAADKQARLAAGRPCLSLDELGQYVNELINDIRQHKRAIKATPLGDGATDASAELTANTIRQIEYRSNAQQGYTTMFENTVQRSYGFLRITPRYVSDTSFDQELFIDPIPNPDMVTPDADAQKPDLSDMTRCFVHESWSKADFERKWPRAQAVSWTPEQIKDSNGWMDGGRIRVAEYWKKETYRDRLVTVRSAQGETTQLLSAFDVPPEKASIIKERPVDRARVVQRFTNGIEILSTTHWPGKDIPIIGCLGKVLYVDAGDGGKRKILSLIRLARDPYMLYCYYRTCEAELVGMTPKTPFIGYVGQFRTRTDDWQKVNHTPLAYLEADPLTEATGANILPLPMRQPYEPPIAALEVGAEAARRAIQAAIGSSPLPTQAQRRNEKSGVALQQIEESAQRGSFHFVDHYDDALTRTGAILADLLPHYYDAAREIVTREADETITRVRINDPQHPGPDGQPVTFLGPHDITLGTGPNYKSEREEATTLSDMILGSPQIAQALGPQKYNELVALAIKLKNVGPLGEQMAEIVSPTQKDDPAQAQQQLAQAGQMIEQLTQHVNDLSEAIKTKQVEQEAKVQIEKVKAEMSIEIQRIKDAAAIAVAEINARAKGVLSANEAEMEAVALAADHAHEAVEAERDRQHQADIASQQHAQALEQGEQGQAHALESQQQAADLAPEPAA